MDKEELKSLARDPRHIRGIFNYCDRWCERCAFTARCLTYSMEQEENKPGDGRDDDDVLGKVSEHLDMAVDLLEDLAEEQGIDFSAVETEEEEPEVPVVHILSCMSTAYFEMANRWFERHPSLPETDHWEAYTHLKLIHPPPATASVSECIEIIRFYQLPIRSKLDRALRSRREEEKFPIEGLPKDSDGSAKVALIELDRSMDAWGGLLNAFREQEQEIQQILGHLKRIRDLAEKEFPDARAFIRPGFDENIPD